MNGSQQTIDFRRGEQLGLLRELRLGRMVCDDGQKISAVAIKSTLNAIDSYYGDECFASQETLARCANVSRRTVQKAILCLLDISLITCELKRSRYGIVCNHYSIVWSEIAIRNRIISTSVGTPVPANDLPPVQAVSPPVRAAEMSPTDAQLVVTDAQLAQTDAQLAQTDAQLLRTKGLKPGIKNLKPPAGNGRTAEIDLIGSVLEPHVDRWRSLAVEFAQDGLTATEVASAIRVARFNSDRFTRWQGALVGFLRTGEWPAAIRSEPQNAAISVDHRKESAASSLIRELRKQRCSDEVIEAELAKRELEWPK